MNEFIKKFLIVIVILFCISLICMIGKCTGNQAPAAKTQQVVEVRNVYEDYTKPGEWSRKYTFAELKSVTGPKDREWQVCLRDPFSKKDVETNEALPPGAFEMPWNTVWMRFRSKSQNLKIEYWATAQPVEATAPPVKK